MFSSKKKSSGIKGISSTDYASNFDAFLEQRPDGKPFYFWLGGHEPHRVFEKGIGLKKGKKLSDVDVPAFLPDTPEIRGDILDYYVEIEWFESGSPDSLPSIRWRRRHPHSGEWASREDEERVPSRAPAGRGDGVVKDEP